MKTIITLLLFMMAIKLEAQQRPKIKLDSKMKSEAITNISNLLIENYIFPDIAEKVKLQLEANSKSGAYDDMDDPTTFSFKMTDDLQGVTKDKHIKFIYDPQTAEALLKGGGDEETNPLMRKKYEEEMREQNYQFKKLEILPGNIGYMDLRGFTDATIPEAKETGAAAMSFLSNTRAIIFDLRENGGGDPNMVQFLCSYLFEGKIHLNDLYSRKTNETTEYWTYEIVPGKKMPNIDVYVLTSKRTFSGAEEFTYNLKNLKRATIVGENTGGGANPGWMMRVTENFVMFVPNGKAINPITKTNWEGTGIAPDIACKKEDALSVAQIEIYKKLISKSSGPEEKQKYEWSLEGIEGKLNPASVSLDVMQKYAGDFGPRKIYFENNELYYERSGVGSKIKMLAIRPDYFMLLDGRDVLRIKFNSDASGNIISLSGIYFDGFSEENKKNN